MKRYNGYMIFCLLFIFGSQAAWAQQKTGTADGIPRDTIRVRTANPTKIPLGYGLIRTHQTITGAVSMIGAKAFDQLGLINPENAFYGKLLGLMVLESGGPPPTKPGMFIRGRQTWHSSGPLILVDGFQRRLARVAPDAIKKVTVLKDAAALAIYGQRGANGVILVTTKRGAAHPLEVNASFNSSVSLPSGFPEFLNAANYARALNEARANDGLPRAYNPSEITLFSNRKSPYLYPDVDWFDKTLRGYGLRQIFDLTFSGGGDVVHYFALLNYVHESGIFGPVNRNKYSTQKKFARVNFRSNLDINLTDELLLQLNISGILDDNNQPRGGAGTGNILSGLYSIPSAAFPVKTPDGNWGGTQIYDNNPMAILTDRGYGYPNNRSLFLDAHIRQNNLIVKGLSAELTVGYSTFASYFQNKLKKFQYEIVNPVWKNGQIVDMIITKRGENTDLDYHQSFGNQDRYLHFVAKVHYHHSFGNDELKAMVFFHQSERIRDGFNNIRRRQNLAANVRYGLNGKYYFDVAASYSGNNYLPPWDRYHVYPAVSAAWLLSKEDFLSSSSVVDFFKLRASWGITGKANIPKAQQGQGFPYIRDFNRGGGGYWFTNRNTHVFGFIERHLGAIDLRGETSYKSNIGIDARLFGGLSLTANLFYAHRTNITTNTQGIYSNVLGIAPPVSTQGVVDNQGVETSLKWQDTIGDVSWHIGGNLLWVHNEIVNSNETYRPYPYLKREGREVGQLFGLQAIGFFKSQQDIATSPTQEFSKVEPGDIKYKDQNGDDIINQYDKVPLGYHTGYPDISFSVFLGVHYKGLGISALFQGTAKYTAFLNTQSVYWPLVHNNTISKYYYTHRWTPQKAAAGTATLPRLTTTANSNNFQQNSIWLVDNSYIKLQSLRISYNLPASLVNKLNLNDIRFMLEGRNLFSIDNIPVGNPEGLGSLYPIMRTYSLGVKVDF